MTTGVLLTIMGACIVGILFFIEVLKEIVDGINDNDSGYILGLILLTISLVLVLIGVFIIE